MPSSDPNGWVSNPPKTLVKVVNVTSRSTLNGCFGVVLHYAEDRQRYVVHMAKTQEQVSLRPENLVKASLMEQMAAQYELLQNDPNIQRQVRSAYSQIQTKTGIKPEYVAGGVLTALLVLIYVLGFTPVFMMLSFALLCFAIIAPDVLAGKDRAAILRNAPMRYRNVLREGIPVVGPRIADNVYLSNAFAALMVVLFVRSMMPNTAVSVWNQPEATTSAPIAASNPPPSVVIPNSASASRHLFGKDAEFFYKMGYDDGKEVKPFGSSLEAFLNDQESQPVKGVEPNPDDEFSFTSDAATRKTDLQQQQKSQPSMWTMVSTAMSFGYVVRQLNQLGTNDGTSPFSMESVIMNAPNMESSTMVLLGLGIYRVVMLLRQLVLA